MRKNNNKKGFTIVELVIVIAVIGILAAVLIPTFSNIINDANKSAALQEARNVYTEYLAEHAKESDLADDFIYVHEADKRYVVIKDGSVVNTVYATEEEALDQFTEGTGENEKEYSKGNAAFGDKLYGIVEEK